MFEKQSKASHNKLALVSSINKSISDINIRSFNVNYRFLALCIVCVLLYTNISPYYRRRMQKKEIYQQVIDSGICKSNMSTNDPIRNMWFEKIHYRGIVTNCEDAATYLEINHTIPAIQDAMIDLVDNTFGKSAYAFAPFAISQLLSYVRYF